MIVRASAASIALAARMPWEAHGLFRLNLGHWESWLLVAPDLLLDVLASDGCHVSELLEQAAHKVHIVDALSKVAAAAVSTTATWWASALCATSGGATTRSSTGRVGS